MADKDRELERLRKLVRDHELVIDGLTKDNEQLLEELEQVTHELDAKPNEGEIDRYQSNEVAKLEREISAMKKDYKKLEQQLQEEKEARERAVQEARDERYTVAELERELEAARHEVAELSAQLDDAQQQAQAAVIERQPSLPRPPHQQSKEHAELADDLLEQRKVHIMQLQQREADIERLQATLQERERELEDIALDLKAVADEAEYTQKAIVQHQQTIGELERQCAAGDNERSALTAHVAALQTDLNNRADVETKMWSEFSGKINEWKRAVEERDVLLVDKERAIVSLQRQLAASAQLVVPAPFDAATLPPPDTDSIDALRRAVVDRDRALHELKAKHDELLGDFELLSVELVRLEDSSDDKVRAALADQRQQLERSRQEVHQTRTALQDEQSRQADERATNAMLQHELVELRSRLAAYETEHGVEQAVRELHAKVKVRDRDIEALVVDVGRATRQRDELLDENRLLRQRVGVAASGQAGDDHHHHQHRDHDHVVSSSMTTLAGQLELEQLRAVNRQHELDIAQLEEERLRLKQAMRSQALNQGERAVKQGLSADKLAALDAFADRLRSGPEHEVVAAEERSHYELRKQIERLETQLRKAEQELRLALLDNDDLQVELHKSRRRAPGSASSAVAAAADAVVALLPPPGPQPTTVVSEATPPASTAASVAAAGPRPSWHAELVFEFKFNQLRKFVLGYEPRLKLTPEAANALLDPSAYRRKHWKLLAQLPPASRPHTAQGLAAHGLLLSASAGVAASDQLPHPAAAAAFDLGFGPPTRELIDEVKELSSQLNEQRHECDRLKQQLTELRAELAAGRRPRWPLPEALQAGGALLAGEALPEELLAYLNEQLIECLDELARRETELDASTAELLRYRSEFKRLGDQQRLLYAEHAASVEAHLHRQRTAAAELDAAKARADEAAATAATLENVLESMAAAASGDDDGQRVRRRLADDAKQLIVLRASEAQLKRRVSALEADDALQRKELRRTHADLAAIDTTMRERLALLENTRDRAYARQQQMQAQLDVSVRRDELDMLRRRYDALLDAHRLALERENEARRKFLERDQAALDASALRAQLADHEMELFNARNLAEKSARALESIRASAGGPNDIAALTGKVVMLELSEESARKKAEMARKKADVFEAAQAEMEQRINELEQQVSTLSQQLHQAQENEVGLRNELHGTLPRQQADELRHQVMQAAAEAASSLADTAKWRELAAVAQQQTHELQRRLGRDDAERESLRAAVRALQPESDKALAVGTLHQQLLAAQMAEHQLLMRVDQLQADATKFHRLYLHADGELETKIEATFKLREQARLR
eukprot:TRINITY_DN2672_c0_g1_i11.p1 TRINITY_DN2672_c0_g1~~TRINITY_DN2672_c0_g1_i11.p1  ORF type:complete len:1321 (+),score=614.05 TRINITY_DN2672_c0_g1_i11:278-4240(+)